MGKKSKTKGAGYELKVAKFLSSWWGGNFSRVPASGGLHWGSDQRVAGDIVPPPEADFPFVIECKKREEWTMDHVLLDIGQPKDWWEQVVEDGRRINKTPMLIFSRNRAKDFIMIPYEEYMYKHLAAHGTDVMRTSVTITNIRDEKQVFDVIVTTMDTFTRLPIPYIRGFGKEVNWDPYAADYNMEDHKWKER
jgi:hypothetical protein